MSNVACIARATLQTGRCPITHVGSIDPGPQVKCPTWPRWRNKILIAEPADKRASHSTTGAPMCSDAVPPEISGGSACVRASSGVQTLVDSRGHLLWNSSIGCHHRPIIVVFNY